MSSDIGVRLGGDNSDFRSMLTDSEARAAKFDAQLEASGVKLSGVPEKYAEASSKVFDQVMADEGEIEAARIQHAQEQEERARKSARESAGVFEAALRHEEQLAAKQQADASALKKAEGDLASFRQQTAYSRMSNEEKLAATQGQARGILEKIDGIEGDTLEKKQLQLEFEQKKSEIFDLNAKIEEEALAQQKKRTEEQEQLNKKGGVFGGLLENFKKGFKDMGVSLGGAGIGVAFAAIVGFGKQAIENAQKQREEYEKIGKPLDQNTRSLATFGDGLATVKKGAVDAVGSVIGFFTSAGENLGMLWNRIKYGIEEADEKIAEAAAREADLAEERAKKLKEEQYDRDKIREAHRLLTDAEKTAATDRMTDLQKVMDLQKQVAALEVKVKDAVVNTVNAEKFKADLVNKQNDLRRATIALITKGAEEEIAAINSAGPLAITYQEKALVLARQRAVLEAELGKLAQGSTEYKKVENDLRTNGIELQKLDREWRKSAALDQAQLLELTRLELKSKTGLTTEERQRLQVLRLQGEEKKTQYQIDELILARSQRELTPEEKAKLAVLLKQEESLQKQLELILKIIKAKKEEVPITEEVAAGEEKILKLVQARVNVEQISSGNGYQNQSTEALRGQRARVSSNLDAARAADFNAAFHVGGTVHDPSIEVFRAQLEKIDRELKLRNEVQSYAQRFGEAAATYQYGDQVTQRALSDLNDLTVRTVTALEAISQQLNPIFPKGRT